jgi:hypothetical protein
VCDVASELRIEPIKPRNLADLDLLFATVIRAVDSARTFD